MPGSRVYLSAEKNAPGTVCISIKNISRDPLNISEEELMERFVRGDESRHTEGSGLGLNIARSLVTLMNGTFDLRIDGDLFRADIVLTEAL
jgi:signal transduction histidine kinase